MKYTYLIIIGVAATSGVIVSGWFGWAELQHTRAVSNLVERTKADLIFVKGGTFKSGNYEVNVRMPGGVIEKRWIIETISARPPKPVTLDSFYILANEASAKDHALFLESQQVYPPMSQQPLSDGSTSMAWSEAQDYCVWLGALADIDLRLPTEDEWEYAARSRGTAVAFATDDGEFRWGINVQDNDRDTPKKPLGSFASNPLGLHDAVEGSYEWVADTAPSDPKGARVAKGSSSASSSFYETIPSRFIIKPANPTVIKLLGSRVQALAELGPIHLAQATARCVALNPQPPEVSGFGRLGGSFDPAPEAFGPYGARNELIEQ